MHMHVASLNFSVQSTYIGTTVQRASRNSLEIVLTYVRKALKILGYYKPAEKRSPMHAWVGRSVAIIHTLQLFIIFSIKRIRSFRIFIRYSRSDKSKTGMRVNAVGHHSP